MILRIRGHGEAKTSRIRSMAAEGGWIVRPLKGDEAIDVLLQI